MKKTAYILAAAMLIAALSGCNSSSGNDGEPAETTKVTQVAFQAEEKEDTTEEALVFLKEQVPLFYQLELLGKMRDNISYYTTEATIEADTVFLQHCVEIFTSKKEEWKEAMLVAVEGAQAPLIAAEYIDLLEEYKIESSIEYLNT